MYPLWDNEGDHDKAASLIRIKIPTEDKSFYYRNQLTGSQKGIASVVFDHSDKMAEFNISTDGYYIATVHLIPNKLFLELNTPKELYGHIVPLNDKIISILDEISFKSS